MQVSDIMLDACMQFENYPMKTVGEEAFYNTLYYTIILKFQKFHKNSKILRSKSTNQVSDVMLDACVQFKNIRLIL